MITLELRVVATFKKTNKFSLKAGRLDQHQKESDHLKKPREVDANAEKNDREKEYEKTLGLLVA